MWKYNFTVLARVGDFIRYLNPNPNLTRNTQTGIQTEVTKYPNGFCIEQVSIPELDQVYPKPKVMYKVIQTYVHFNPNLYLSSNM